MQQWREIKARHPDALVLFRVGDFYEMFNEDAEAGARLLDLTLTSRNNGSSRAPLAGIPAQALQTYLQRLVALGRRVAVCEQVEDPAAAKGIVRREVVETVTPGALLADGLLQARRNNYLVALAGNPYGGAALGAACADLSTGELLLQTVPPDELNNLLAHLEPAELLLPDSWEQAPPPAVLDRLLTFRPDWLFDAATAEDELKRRFGVLSVAGFGLGEGDDPLCAAGGALLAYLYDVQPGGAAALRPPHVVRGGAAMPLDEMTRRNLELVEPLRGGGDRGATLLAVLDNALTAMGGRLLRRWVLAPLVCRDAIERRHDAVDFFRTDADARAALRRLLAGVGDLERLAIKVGSGRANPRDLLALAASLRQVPLLHDVVSNSSAALLREHAAGLDPLPELCDLLERALDPEAPAILGEAGVVRAGYNAQLDQLRDVRTGAVDWIARLQATERERTGIPSLKIGFNKVFGYYLEVTRTHLERVPEHYQRRQTLANAERYVTPELKEWEETVLGADEKIAGLEAELFQEVRALAASDVPRIQALADHIAAIDVLAGLAETAARRGYTRPRVHDGYDLYIRRGRHPVVETMMPREEFIPNDIRLDGDARLMILTGPNMAGKSTVLRQVGLIVLLAQMGSFVPAEEAALGIVDRMYTRVGASDNLVRGQSTFMVEMSETAAILNGATQRSLVLLDEIGRGTSTWDGLSVATAVAEHLHDTIGAKTIFATHYHELTQLADRLPGGVNFSVAVREEHEQILFLRRLVPGGADRSYGVEVARLAGMPRTVIRRARQMLQELERGRVGAAAALHRSGGARPVAPEPQLALFAPQPHPVVERLRSLDLPNMTPIQALNALAELCDEAQT